MKMFSGLKAGLEQGTAGPLLTLLVVTALLKTAAVLTSSSLILMVIQHWQGSGKQTPPGTGV